MIKKIVIRKIIPTFATLLPAKRAECGMTLHYTNKHYYIIYKIGKLWQNTLR